MLDFKTNFAKTQKIIRDTRMGYIIERSLTVQTRNKIKPSSLNPVLLNTVSKRGW